MSEESLNVSPALWDAGFAGRLRGRVIVVSITYATRGPGVRHEQLYGVVADSDEERGIMLELDGSRRGETYWLPPNLALLHQAAPGMFRLKTTGEIVFSPDYECRWRVAAPPLDS